MYEMMPQPAPGVLLLQRSAAARALVLTTLFAALTALGAQAAIPLPFTPVPVTLQVFFVLLSAAALGPRLAALSQVQYLAIGAAGLPVFAGGVGGPMALGGPTAGYLFGFVACAWVTGGLAERMARPGAAALFLAMLAGLATLYASGAAWLAVWMGATGQAEVSEALSRAVALGVAPFAGVDMVKALLAALAVARLYRRAQPPRTPGRW